MWRAITIFLLLNLGNLAGTSLGFAASKPKVADPLGSMQPMKVVFVRDARAGCAPKCADWIAAQGDIVRDTPAEFRKVFKALAKRKLPIFVSSNGGSVEAAIAIGRLIRANGFDVAVTRSDILPCVASGKACPDGSQSVPFPGLPNSGSAICASSCSLLLAGGVRRVAPDFTHIGVHQIIAFRTLVRVKRTFRITKRVDAGIPVIISKTLIKEKTISRRTSETPVTDKNYKPIATFLKDMDVEQTLIWLMQGTPNTSIHWMSAGELQVTNMTTDAAGGEILLGVPVDSGAAPIGMTNGHPVTVSITAGFDAATKSVTLTLLPRLNGAAVVTSKALATIRLPGGTAVLAVNPQELLPFGPLQATVTASDVCLLKRQSRVSVRFDLEIDGQPAHLRSTVDLGRVEALSAILKTACGAKA